MSSFTGSSSGGAAASKLQQLLQQISAGEQLLKVDLSNEGLDEFPMELMSLKDSLEFLNMGGNNLRSLPQEITEFKRLRIMFFAQNQFEELPLQLGQMKSLFMLSFKSNRLKTVAPESLSPSIAWLILTDNQLHELPASIGQLKDLKKLMLAGNKLTALPDELQRCTELELLRIAANQIPSLPPWLLRMPKLSWLAYSGNPIQGIIATPAATKAAATAVSSPVSNLQTETRSIPWSELVIGEVLGQGASGVVHRASWAAKPASCSSSSDSSSDGDSSEKSCYEGGSAVAVKLFRAGMTSDGLPEDEMKATEMVGNHPNFIGVFGRVVDSPSGQAALLLPMLSLSKYKILGDPPSFSTITRDTYPLGTSFALVFVVKVLMGLAAACLHLHRNCGIIHGDFYAHNILAPAVITESQQALLTDFGAASFKPADAAESELLERVEVRAFGCLIEDMIAHIEPAESSATTVAVARREDCVLALQQLMSDCTASAVEARPNFASISSKLSSINAMLS